MRVGVTVNRTTALYADASYQIGLDGRSSRLQRKGRHQGELVKRAVDQ